MMPHPMEGRRSFDLTFGTSSTQTTPWTDRRRLSWEDLADLLTTHQFGRKDGACVVPAVFSGDSRLKEEARKIDVAFLDSDTGYTLDEIRKAVTRNGWAAAIASTHSHMTTRTRVSRANWEKFCAQQEGDVDGDSLAFAYLTEAKGYLPHVAEGAYLDAERPGEVPPKDAGRFVFFEHSPCPKFRVAIPLAKPWVASEYQDHKAARAAWKERVEALASALNLIHDQSCTDTSRLFYLPRRPRNGAEPETEVIQGDPCDIFALPAPPVDGLFGAAAAKQKKQDNEAREFQDEETGEVVDLAAWAKEFGSRFEIVKALKARKPGVFTGLVVSDKHHIICANEGEHTNAGTDAATFIMDASRSESRGFVYHCRHGHCTAADGITCRDRLFFVHRMLEQRWIGVEDLTAPEFLTDAPKAKAEKAGKKQKPEAETDWPDPIDFLADAELTGAPELLPEHLPDTIYRFSIDTAQRMGVDPAAVAIGALVSCASVVTDDWRLQVKRRDTSWTESPRLWGAIVGDPSIKKTPVIAACTKPVERMEGEARKAHSEALAKFKVAEKEWKADKGEECDRPVMPRGIRYLVEGATMEALSEVLRDDEEARFKAPAKKILVRQDEMSEWVASFDRYGSGKGGADRGGWLRLYNGGRFSVDRVMRGSFAIPNWSACFIGGIQPGPIQKMAQDATDDGLLQRFCYCVPGREEPEQDRAPDRAVADAYNDLLHTLSALTPSLNQFGDRERPVVMDEGAHRIRESVFELASALASMPDTPARLKAAYGKWPGLFARLCLIFHLIERAVQGPQGPSVQVLREETAAKAAAYLRDVLLPHLLRADALMYATAQTGHARWIAGLILARGKPVVTLRDVVQAYRPLRAPEHRRQLLEVMSSLEAMAWIRDPDAEPGRIPTRWMVNPAVLTTFAARAEEERTRRAEAVEAIRELIARKLGRA